MVFLKKFGLLSPEIRIRGSVCLFVLDPRTKTPKRHCFCVWTSKFLYAQHKKTQNTTHVCATHQHWIFVHHIIILYIREKSLIRRQEHRQNITLISNGHHTAATILHHHCISWSQSKSSPKSNLPFRNSCNDGFHDFLTVSLVTCSYQHCKFGFWPNKISKLPF